MPALSGTECRWCGRTQTGTAIQSWRKRQTLENGENLHFFVNPLTFQARPKASTTPS
jgi:hypothetical protein